MQPLEVRSVRAHVAAPAPQTTESTGVEFLLKTLYVKPLKTALPPRQFVPLVPNQGHFSTASLVK